MVINIFFLNSSNYTDRSLPRDLLYMYNRDKLYQYIVSLVINVWLIQVIWYLFFLNKVLNSNFINEKKIAFRKFYFHNGLIQFEQDEFQILVVKIKKNILIDLFKV